MHSCQRLLRLKSPHFSMKGIILFLYTHVLTMAQIHPIRHYFFMLGDQ